MNSNYSDITFIVQLDNKGLESATLYNNTHTYYCCVQMMNPDGNVQVVNRGVQRVNVVLFRG